jgi:GGDEF domain-containing protein
VPTPPLSLDDLLADVPPRRQRQPATASGGPTEPFDLDAMLGDFGDVQGGASTAPAPRRGIAHAVTDFLGSFDKYAPREETRRMVPPTDRRTQAQRVSDERAAAAQQFGRVPAEATATPTQTFVPAPGSGVPVEANVADQAATQAKLRTRARLTGQFSPEKWRQVAVAGMEYANQLHAQGKHDEAEDVLRKAYNAQLLSEGAKEADTHGAIVLSNLLGIIKDPYAGQRRNVAEAMQPGMVATPEEQQTMGIAKPTAPDRPFSASKDIVAPLVGAAPMIVGTGLAGRGLAALGAGVAERYGFETAAKAFTSLAQPSEITALAGPKVPVTSAANLATRIGEEVQEFRAALPSMLKRGATEGQLAMGAQQYRMARQQGATVEQALGAAIQGAELNIPMGAAAEVGLGIAGRAAGVGYDPIGHLASRIRDRVRGTEVVGPEALDAADAARSADGQLPITDQTPEAAHRKIAGALEDLLNQRKTAQDAETRRLSSRFEDVQSAFEEQPPPAGRNWWEANAPGGDRMVEPVEGYRAREENPPLRTAAEIASERARPTDEANAMVRMQREEEFGRAARMEAEQAAQDPNLRLEQAAQQRPEEVQGPRTLGETLADAQEQRDQGEPLASDYHDAINKYVDALAQVRDLPEDQTPTMRQQVALARAKQALNDARKRYGRQLGASAVLALALNDDELSDDEKKFGGLAAVGLLGVPEGEREPIKAEPGVFSSRLRTAIEALGKDREGKGGKAWDTPRPAADWIGKLKNSNEFSKNELKLIMPELEGAQREKLKLARADVLRIAEDKLPRIEPTTLADAPVPERATATREPGALPEGDADDITDIDDVNPDDRDPFLEAVPITPKGKTEFSTYQRIGGGTDYSELVFRWDNRPEGDIPTDAYGGHDYWSRAGVQSAIGHVRREMHVVYDTPDVSGSEIRYEPGEPENIRLLKSRIEEVRKKRDTALDQMNALAAEFTALPETDRESSRATEIANKYRDLNNDVKNFGTREDELAAEIRDRRGLGDKEGKPVNVMIENQASLAQHQSHLGPPPDPAEVARLRREYENANEAYERAVTASNDAESAAKGVSQEYEAIADRAFDVYGAVNNALRDEYERATGRSYLPSGWQIEESSWEPTFKWLEEHGGDEMRTVIGRLREARQQQATLEKATDEAETVMRTARRDWRDAEGDGSDLRVDTPFNDTQAAIQLNAAGFLLDAANRGSERVAWSDGANRVRNAHQQISAARYVYDQATPAAMRRLLGYLGFKDVKPEKIWIKGNGHWMIELTPDMRRAIRKYGLPALGVMALVGSPSEAKAQDTASDSSTRSLYSGVVGGIVAGAALAALMASKKLRRLVKENRELNRALMIDDLSGLANKRAFARARESVDTDPATSWVALDASQFKRVNDTAGHDAGDQAIAHFGRAIVAAAKDAGVPMRGFRSGGDEFAFAVPKGREAEFIDAVEQTSKRSFGGVDTQLHGAAGDTFTEADARLMTRKRDLGVSRGGYEQSDLFKTARRAEQTLVSNAISDAEIGDIVDRLKKGQAPATGEEAEIVARAIAEAQLPKDLPQGVVLHANPIGPAMRQLARYPSSAALIGLGALLGESDNDNVRRAGVPTMVLGALSVIGSHRLSMGAEALGDGIIKTLGTTQAGRRAIEFLNPSILLSREAKQALEKYREGLSYGRAVALEHSRAAERLGPEGNRAVSDVIENEGWEDVSKFTPQQMSDVLTVAAGIESEVRKLTDAKITHGVLRPEQAIPNYLKREYAHFDVLDALADHQGYGQAAGKTMGAATKSRVLDEPIHAAEAALADAQQSGDAQKIKAAQDALTEANLVQQQNRTTLGEIREASYRVGKSFDQGWHDVAAAKLHETLRNVPGTIHPDYARALDDFLAARDLAKQATTTADRDAARALVDRAYIEMREIGDRYKAKDGDWRTLPEGRSYGVLRGMPVTRAIHAELTPAFDPNSWDDFVQFWKQAKTIFNVGTSVANVASNVMFSHMEGLPIYQQPKYLRAALKDLKAYGPATRVLAERGVLEASATFSPNEIKNPAAMRSEEGLSDLFATTRPETRAVMEQRGLTAERIQRNKRVGTIGRTVAGAAMGMALTADEDNPEDAAIGAVGGLALGAVLTPKVRNLIRRGYANEDNLFRLALYLKKLDDGIPSDYAAKYAKQSLGDMSAPQSPATQWIRRTASPFFLYPLRAVPRFAQQAIDHPWRYVALMGAMAAVDLYSRSQVGDVPERDLAPADRRDMFGYFLPGFTQLPLTDEQGNKGGVDLARWTPLSALTSSAPPGATGGALSDEFPAVFQPSGPLLDLGGRLAANVDPFSGKPLIKKDYPLGENISNVLNQAGEMAAPSMLAFHRRRLEDDVRNRDWTKFKNDVLGPTGMRPRYVRPGGEVRQATFQLGEDLNAMKHEFSQAMIANKNPDRSAQIVDQYLRRVTSALSHFSERIGPPPKELVNQALDVRTP